jgi:HK97 family phage prohead protease
MEHAYHPLDLKKLAEGQISGLAAGYGNVDSHGETFAPGAFTESLRGSRPVAMLLHHDKYRPAGRWDGLTESDKGLHAAGTLALDAPDGREAYALAKAGALTGLSVGFIKREGRGTVITKADLWEISLVAIPSNPLTYVEQVKSVANVRELEDHLREIGLSGRRAKAAAAAAFRAADEAKDDQAMAQVAERLAQSTRKIATLMGVK